MNTIIAARVVTTDASDEGNVSRARSAMDERAMRDGRRVISDPALVRAAPFAEGVVSLDYEAETAPL